MASINKVKVKSVTYDISPSATGSFVGTSNDTASPTAWTSVDALANEETNGSIFTKLSKMFSNVRYLYSQLGTNDYSATGATSITEALKNLQANKAAATHAHTVANLPVSSTQINSSAKIPTSSLVYSMGTTLDAVSAQVKGNANSRFEEKNLGTWSTTTQVDTFCTTYTHANDYKGLSLGNYVTIQDGTYNGTWMIAGFDYYKNRGDTDNGYGIVLIPRIPIGSVKMNDTDTTVGGYWGSTMATTTLPAVATAMQTVLGTHLIQRRTLVSTAIDETAKNRSFTGVSSNWAWNSEYVSLMSEPQAYGCCVWGGNCDVGEATNILPVFRYINFVEYSRRSFWFRAVASSAGFARAGYDGGALAGGASGSGGLRPLIYLR